MHAEELNPQFEEYCKSVYSQWEKSNPMPQFEQYQFNPGWVFDEFEESNNKWREYIKPLAEKWWRERGYRLIWPTSRRGACSVESLA